MSVKGQTHNKRAREFALREKRERKQAKKDARNAGTSPEADGGAPILGPEPEPEPEAESKLAE